MRSVQFKVGDSKVTLGGKSGVKVKDRDSKPKKFLKKGLEHTKKAFKDVKSGKAAKGTKRKLAKVAHKAAYAFDEAGNKLDASERESCDCSCGCFPSIAGLFSRRSNVKTYQPLQEVDYSDSSDEYSASGSSLSSS